MTDSNCPVASCDRCPYRNECYIRIKKTVLPSICLIGASMVGAVGVFLWFCIKTIITFLPV